MARKLGQGSLFERLEPDAPLRRSLQGRSDVSDRVRAVKRQIEALLNTRRGGSQSSPEFGLPDFNDAAAGSTDLLLRIARGIREAIETHEPRLLIQDVRFMPRADAPLELTFRLHCALRVESHAEAIEIDLIMNGHNRHYQVV